MVSSRTPEQIRRAAKKSRHIFVKSNLKVKVRSYCGYNGTVSMKNSRSAHEILNFCEQAFTLEMLKQSNEQTQAAGTNETNHNEEKVWIENQCVVCFNEFENGDEIGWSESCDHIFHRDCIYAWLLKHPECRCCRRNFFNISDKGEEKRSSHAETEDVDMEMGNMRTHRDSGEEIPPSPNNNSLSTAYVAEVLDSTG